MKWLFKPILYLVYLVLSIIVLYLCFIFLRAFYESLVAGNGSLGYAGEYAIEKSWEAIKDLLRFRF